jgi:hypothetical protein
MEINRKNKKEDCISLDHEDKQKRSFLILKNIPGNDSPDEKRWGKIHLPWINTNKLLTLTGVNRNNFGYTILSKIYHELELDLFNSVGVLAEKSVYFCF